jgi:hypothetical protein
MIVLRVGNWQFSFRMTSMPIFGPSCLKAWTGQFTDYRNVLFHTNINRVVNKMSLNKQHLEGTITLFRSIQCWVIFSPVRKISFQCLVNPKFSTTYCSIATQIHCAMELIQTTKKFQVFMELERLASYLERADISGVPRRGGVPISPLPSPRPPPKKILSFDKAEPNSQFRGKYIRNNLIRIRISLICKLNGTPD